MVFAAIPGMKTLFLVSALLAMMSCGRNSIPEKGMAAAFSFENGRAEDLSGNGNSGVVRRADETRDRFGRKDHALEFSSSRHFVEVESPDFMRARKGSVVLWVRFDELDKVQYLASFGDANAADNYFGLIRLDPVTKTLGVYYNEQGKIHWVQGKSLLTPQNYYCIVLNADGRNWSMFINGKKEDLEVRQGRNAGYWAGELKGIDNFVVGSTRIKPPYEIPNLNGVIDAVVVYNRPLRAKEIKFFNGASAKKKMPY